MEAVLEELRGQKRTLAGVTSACPPLLPPSDEEGGSNGGHADSGTGLPPSGTIVVVPSADPWGGPNDPSTT